MKKTTTMMILAAMFALSLTGCNTSNSETVSTQPETSASSSKNDTAAADQDTAVTAGIVNTAYTGSSDGMLDTTSLFTDRDLCQTADLTDASYLTAADGETLRITEAGVYVISGSASNCTILVDADAEAKVQLVLDGVSITNDDFPAIYAVSADKVFVTLSGENALAVTGSFRADGDTNTDAVIFSKDDLVLNGTGSLTLTSAAGNGITSKDDLKITGGTYTLSTALDAIEANDLIAVCGGTFDITTQKDGLHCENDSAEGTIYLADGSFRIQAASDGIQATAVLQIDGGSFTVTASEGLEATYVQINGGTIDITASDDGINASNKSSVCAVAVEFNGGDTTISMGQGDTDAVDANGSIYVNGGTINITAPTSSFDYDQTAEFNGGTIIINGEEVSEIPQSMMGGGPGGQGGFGGQGGPGGQGGFGGHRGGGRTM